MLSILLFSSLLASSFTVTPSRAADYTKIGVKVGDWAYYSMSGNGTLAGYVNVTITNIDRSNVTTSASMYATNGTLMDTYIFWSNISSGEFGVDSTKGLITSTPSFWYLIVADLTKGDPIYLNSPYCLNDTGTMITCGKARVYTHLNATFSVYYNETMLGIPIGFYIDQPTDIRWDRATGIPIYESLNMSSWTYQSPPGKLTITGWVLITLILTRTSLWSSADYTKVGVKAGDWAYYSVAEVTGGVDSGLRNANITIMSVDRGNVTFLLREFCANGTIVSQTMYGNVTSGVSPSGSDFAKFLTAANLGENDSLSPTSPFWINGTVGVPIFGESRVCNYATHGEVYLSWDQATGITTKIDETIGGPGNTYSWNMTSTSLWSPAPTVDQPSGITYTYGSTGHNITWHPSSNVPNDYTITKNGTKVGSANWNGKNITYSVDGLAPGTYAYACTVNDTIGRHASSTVIVKVNFPTAPTIDHPSSVTYTFGATGNSITWHPSSQFPQSYTITRNGTVVTSGTWNGQAITCSVDGLQADTYLFNCTVVDSTGQRASSIVTVTVSAAPPSPAPGLPASLIIVVGVIAVVVIAVGVVVLRRRRV
jgi:hypothetical protein